MRNMYRMIVFTGIMGMFFPINNTHVQSQEEPGTQVIGSKDQNRRILSGRILDGLGRPVSDVKVKVESRDPGQEKPIAVMFSGEDGSFSCSIPKKFEKVHIGFEKETFVYCWATSPVASNCEFIIHRKIDWDNMDLLPWSEGDKLENALRELLASEEGSESKVVGFVEVDMNEGRLVRFMFKNQMTFLPVLRRLIKDERISKQAKQWLDKFGDPKDQDVMRNIRENAPKHDIKEEDLIEALKGISKKLNFFSKNPEPKIDDISFTFTPNLDRVMIECWINSALLSGFRWEFVFHKEGRLWVLRSMECTGRA
jgi:hypothetical protein